MRDINERLNYLIQTVPAKAGQYSEQEFSLHRDGGWSKKEILGHLCDSASNNCHGFIRIQFEKQPFMIVPYDQNNWVLIQDYQGMPLDEIISLWTVINKHILRVISRIPEETLGYVCDLGDNKSCTLLEWVQDYLRHLEHHLKQIFGTSEL